MSLFKLIREWSLMILIGLIFFIVIPFVVWKYSSHSNNLNKSGVYGVATVIEVNGFNKNKIVYTYTVGGEKYKKYKKAPSMLKLNIDDELKIIYDSLNHDNCRVIWKE